MDDFKTHILLFFLPLIIGNVLHMIVVKKKWFSRLSIPISIKLFGKNKTVRGFVVLPILCGFIAYIFSIYYGPFTHSSYYDLLVGAGLGLVYMLSELPNSFVKRRLGIANGDQSEQYKFLQLLMDKCDSIIGVLLFYYFVVSIPFKSILSFFLIALSIHIMLSYFLVVIKVKKSF